MRLDRFLSNLPQYSRLDARLLIAAGRVRVDDLVIRDGAFVTRLFNRICLDEQILQTGKAARYFMLHKPAGVVSATQHPEHPTVLDLLNEPDKHELHIGGRLDLNTTGLLIITNDGLWSRRLTNPGTELGKVYQVEVEQVITEQYRETFARGIYFAFEDLTTRPTELEILSSHRARLTLHEGRYHQVKRMFGHFQNRVMALHREKMGPLQLDPNLAPGQYRPLSTEEIALI